jgi:hypothetical protein
MIRALLLGSLLCVAANPQSLPLRMERTADNTLTIGNGCSPDAPCNVRIGSVVHSIMQPASITITGGTGTAYVYISAQGQLTAGHNLQAQCAGCTAVTGITSFPADALPLWLWTATKGKWDKSGTDQRAAMGTVNITADSGIVLTRKPGETRIGLSPALWARRTAVPSAAASECTEGDWSVDTRHFYICVAPNQWRRAVLESW